MPKQFVTTISKYQPNAITFQLVEVNKKSEISNAEITVSMLLENGLVHNVSALNVMELLSTGDRKSLESFIQKLVVKLKDKDSVE